MAAGRIENAIEAYEKAYRTFADPHLLYLLARAHVARIKAERSNQAQRCRESLEAWDRFTRACSNCPEGETADNIRRRHLGFCNAPAENDLHTEHDIISVGYFAPAGVRLQLGRFRWQHLQISVLQAKGGISWGTFDAPQPWVGGGVFGVGGHWTVNENHEFGLMVWPAFQAMVGPRCDDEQEATDECTQPVVAGVGNLQLHYRIPQPTVQPEFGLEVPLFWEEFKRGDDIYPLAVIPLTIYAAIVF